MQSILDAINEWIKEILIGAINGNLSTMFGDVNEKVGTIAAEVGRTPQAWNANVFSMIRALSENVIVPIAGLVITYVLCYELISMVTEKNNMHDIDTFMFFKWIFKAFVAVYLVTHTFDINAAAICAGSFRSAGAFALYAFPYPVIVAATKGDPDAMKIVLQHFSGYIASLSMRKLCDERGNVYFGVDEDIRERLQARLMRAILTFRAE